MDIGKTLETTLKIIKVLSQGELTSILSIMLLLIAGSYIVRRVFYIQNYYDRAFTNCLVLQVKKVHREAIKNTLELIKGSDLPVNLSMTAFKALSKDTLFNYLVSEVEQMRVRNGFHKMGEAELERYAEQNATALRYLTHEYALADSDELHDLIECNMEEIYPISEATKVLTHVLKESIRLKKLENKFMILMFLKPWEELHV